MVECIIKRGENNRQRPAALAAEVREGALCEPRNLPLSFSLCLGSLMRIIRDKCILMITKGILSLFEIVCIIANHWPHYHPWTLRF